MEENKVVVVITSEVNKKTMPTPSPIPIYMLRYSPSPSPSPFPVISHSPTCHGMFDDCIKPK